MIFARSVNAVGGFDLRALGQPTCRTYTMDCMKYHSVFYLRLALVLFAGTNHPHHSKMVNIQPLIVLHPPHYFLIWICRIGLHHFLFNYTDFFSSIYLAVAWGKGWSCGLFSTCIPRSRCPVQMSDSTLHRNPTTRAHHVQLAGQRLDSGACGYAVAWKRGNEWRGQKVHMGGLQPRSVRRGVHGHVCALRIGAQRRKQHKVERITTFTAFQAVIKRIQTLAVGPGQTITARRILAESTARWRPGSARPIGASRATRSGRLGSHQCRLRRAVGSWV